MSSSSSGTGASLLGTGVRDNLEGVALKFGLPEEGFLGLVRSGSFTELVALGVLLKNDWMLFWPDAEPAFFNVVGVEADGVEDFFAMIKVLVKTKKSKRTLLSTPSKDWGLV